MSARTESIKLIANWFNTASGALITVGVFTPLAVMVYGIGDPPRNQDLLSAVPIVCICGSAALHLFGQLSLLMLEETDDQ